mmetsp:Transcript_27726/g.65843  ORF Transcript_27726/g.65843 Transcript_27726/m.65843 type:complete len:513 (+) Transcript_27726:65-1603(+)
MFTMRSAALILLVGACQAALPAPTLTHASPMRLKGGGWFGLGSKILQFDASIATDRVKKVWKHDARFGMEDEPYHIYFEEIISDRFALTKGLQLIRDELLLAFNRPNHRNEDQNLKISDVQECAADLSIPSVLSTCAYTVCGDRICQSSSLRDYNCAVAGRFASLTERGEPKPELFFATGGGTDSGPTLAHVTVAHSIDPVIKKQIYNNNAKSFLLVNIDICTHCGHLDIGKNGVGTLNGKKYSGVGAIYGQAQESVFRDPRTACGAIVGMLTNFNLQNPVHVRLRNDLGEANYQFLSKNDVPADDGSPCRFLIAAAIIAIQGMRNTLEALGPGGELDERGVGHMTAQVQINNGDNNECILYCARGTVFNGEMRVQGLGVDASRYSAKMVTMKDGKKRVKVLYDGTDQHPILARSYSVQANAQVTNPAKDDEPEPARTNSPVPTISMSASSSPARQNPRGRVTELESQVTELRQEVREGWTEFRQSIKELMSAVAPLAQGDEAAGDQEEGQA